MYERTVTIVLPFEGNLAIIHMIRQKVADGEYEFTLLHLFEEMADDNLVFPDIEMAIAHGHIRRRLTRDPRGTRYEIIGPATDEREIAVICRIKTTGKLLFITTYTLEEA